MEEAHLKIKNLWGSLQSYAIGRNWCLIRCQSMWRVPREANLKWELLCKIVQRLRTREEQAIWWTITIKEHSPIFPKECFTILQTYQTHQASNRILIIWATLCCLLSRTTIDFIQEDRVQSSIMKMRILQIKYPSAILTRLKRRTILRPLLFHHLQTKLYLKNLV